MCGICLLLSQDDDSDTLVKQELKDIQQMLNRRGPDYTGIFQVLAPKSSSKLQIANSLLQLRGYEPAQVPLTHQGLTTSSADASDHHDVVLAYNGEIFGGLEGLHPGQNDGRVLFQALATSSDQVPKVLSQLEGPWSIVLWERQRHRIWFGRDPMGRRSLLLRWPDQDHPHLTITSIAPPSSSRSSTNNANAASAAAEDSNGKSSTTTIPGSLEQQQQRKHQQRDDDGEEDEGALPTASTWQPWTSSTWQEVPPGLYCLQLATPGSAGSTAALGEATEGQVPSSAISDDQQSRICRIGRDAWCFSAVPWATQQAQVINQYVRPESMMFPPGCNPDSIPEPGSVPRNNAAALHQAAKQKQQAGNGDVNADAGGQMKKLTKAQKRRMAKEQQQQAGENQTAVIDSTTTSNPAHQSSHESNQNGDSLGFQQHDDAEMQALFDSFGVERESVDKVRNALRDAVRTRCECIEEHTLHAASHSVTVLKSSIHEASKCDDNAASFTPAGAGTDASSDQAGNGADSDSFLPSSPLLILFSGGVDSTLLAALAHQVLPPGVPIDLSNVCFDNGKSPDRLAAINAVQELSRYAPERTWRLIQVDSSLEEVDKHKQHILDLLHPAGTVMDLNIGAALWLAVGATGRTFSPQPSTRQQSPPGNANAHTLATQADLGPASPQLPIYKSRARVVLMGHGADEQCAGYGRHRTRYATGGWRALSDELALDVRRLWLRNLGRDDRLVADWGREARHPFLDENFMKTLLVDVLLHHTCNLHLPPGIGDKRLLRAALATLGLPQAATRVKRAIQFGTRIGRFSNCRDFGSNRAANKANAGSVNLSQLTQKDEK